MRISYRRPVAAALLAVALLAVDVAPADADGTWPTDGGGAGSTVTVVRPADQSATVGDAIVPIRVEATDSDPSRILWYTAVDLPAGLTLSPVIGAISGTPTEAGTAVVTVTVSDGTGAPGTTSFTWTVAGAGGQAPKSAVTTTAPSQLAAR